MKKTQVHHILDNLLIINRLSKTISHNKTPLIERWQTWLLNSLRANHPIISKIKTITIKCNISSNNSNIIKNREAGTPNQVEDIPNTIITNIESTTYLFENTMTDYPLDWLMNHLSYGLQNVSLCKEKETETALPIPKEKPYLRFEQENRKKRKDKYEFEKIR